MVYGARCPVPGFEVASEASAPPLSSLVSAFLQVPWTPAAEPRQSVFWTQVMAPRSQKFTTVQNGYALQFCLEPTPFRGITNTFVTDPPQAFRRKWSPCCAIPAPIAIPPSSRGDQGGWEEASQLMQKDKGGELEPPAVEEPGFEVASEASAPPLSSLVSAFLQVPWTPAAEPRQSVFWTQVMAPRSQKFTTVQNGYALQFCLEPTPFRGITNTFVTDPPQAFRRKWSPCCASEPFIS
ncbi:UNVERIFIED_CONTAM: hypothetical protein FKN15_055811 [Acipenser sinensis]